jgi:hypothetical protein
MAVIGEIGRILSGRDFGRSIGKDAASGRFAACGSTDICIQDADNRFQKSEIPSGGTLAPTRLAMAHYIDYGRAIPSRQGFTTFA